MNRVPTTKTLRRFLTAEQATAVRAALTMSRAELEATPEGAARVRECFHAPSTDDLRMTVCNARAGMFGVEVADLKRGPVEYLNTGDAYGLTLLRFPSGAYRVGDWGTLAERES